jgi:cyclase
MKNTIRVIPKLDIKGPHLVKGINLEGLRVLGEPRNFINFYYDAGADEFIYHDVVASLYLRNNLDFLLKKTSKDIFLPIIVGGGIRKLEDIESLLKSGADRIFFNTAAIQNPKLIDLSTNYFGSSTILISIEAISVNNKYLCSIDFGREQTQIDVLEWIKEIQDRGAGELIITSIEKEGVGKGFDLKLAEKISQITTIPYIIHGGFGKLSHIDELLNCCNPSGISISSALHYSMKFNTKLKNEKEGNIEFIKKRDNYLGFENFSLKKIKDYLEKKNKFS